MNEPMMMLSRDANGSTRRRFAATETAPAAATSPRARPLSLLRLLSGGRKTLPQPAGPA